MASQDQTGLVGRSDPLGQPQPTLTPVMTPTTLLFLTKLAASQAAGVAAIQLSLVNSGGHQVEELNSNGEVINGFVLYAVGDTSKRNVTGVAVLQVGSGKTLLPFTPKQQSAWGLIRDELTQFKAAMAVQSPAGGTGTKAFSAGDGPFWLGVLVTYIDCAAAIVEGGANPLADAGCVAGVVAGNWEINTTDDDNENTDFPVIDIPTDPEPIGPITSSAPDDPPPPPSDGDDSGGDSGGGSGGAGGGDDGDPGDGREED